MKEHQYLAYDFKLTNIKNILIVVRSGGLDLVLKNIFVTMDGLMINDEEIWFNVFPKLLIKSPVAVRPSNSSYRSINTNSGADIQYTQANIPFHKN